MRDDRSCASRGTAGRAGRALIVVVLFANCVPDLSKSRTSISDDLDARTGAGLRTQHDREFAIPAGLRIDDSLTVDEAIAIWNNASFQADLAQLGMARADLAEAGVLPNPVVTLLFPLGPKQLETTFLLPALYLRFAPGTPSPVPVGTIVESPRP